MQFQDKQQNINIEVLTNTPAVFDRTYITQVIANLFSNAIKFTPEGKSIYIVIEKNILNDKAGLCLYIEDEGVGIPEDELDMVFDKFIQSSKTKTGAGGTGLGLSICQEIMQIHNGKILGRKFIRKRFQV